MHRRGGVPFGHAPPGWGAVHPCTAFGRAAAALVPITNYYCRVSLSGFPVGFPCPLKLSGFPSFQLRARA